MSAIDEMITTYFTKKVLSDNKTWFDASAELAALRARVAELEQAVNEARKLLITYKGGYVPGCQCAWCAWLSAHPAPEPQPC